MSTPRKPETSCKLPMQPWETHLRRSHHNQLTNEERALLSLAASAALRRQTHALFKPSRSAGDSVHGPLRSLLY